MPAAMLQVPIKDVLRIEVWDDDPVDFDDKLGIVEISIKDEVAPANNSTIEKVCPCPPLPTALSIPPCNLDYTAP